MVDVSFSLFTVEYFILILVRVTGLISTAPFFNTRNTPARVRVALGAFIALLLMETVNGQGTYTYSGSIGYGILVLQEGITGMFIGLAANICNSIILFAGNMIDTHLGLSMATEYDPQNGAQVTLNSSFYNYLFMMLLIISDMHQYIIRALADTYTLIPIGGATFGNESLYTGVVTFCLEFFSIAFRITLPVFSCIMILNCVLGIMAKVAPQMNMFAVGIQIKIISGYAILFVTVAILPRMANLIFDEMKTMMVRIIESMMR